MLLNNSDINNISGSNNSDTLEGTVSNDRLIGRLGSDTLTGGEGADRYILRNSNKNEFDTFNLTEEVDARDVVVLRQSESDYNLYAVVEGFDESDRIRIIGGADYRLFTNRLGNTNLIVQDGELTHVLHFEGVDSAFIEQRIIN